ncbi:MAG: TlpA disulfide reductase family protein [Myxococcota bacterium]|nr:TlpA disulfide reductase family protein [Myxococcota bacterium]
MSLAQAVIRGVLGRVAQRVAQNHLFEQPGEREPTPPLREPKDAEPGRGFSTKLGGESLSSPMDVSAKALCQPMGLRGVLERIADHDGPLVLHHWATWCAPCEEELPLIQELAASLPEEAEVLGLSWDAFEGGGDPAQDAERVGQYAKKMGLDFPTLLLTDAPEKVFKALELGFQQIPQTRVLDGSGATLLQFDGPLSAQDIERVRSTIQEAL